MARCRPPGAGARSPSAISTACTAATGALIDRVAAKARELKLVSCVLTFEPHPREFFSRDAAPARLTRLRDKLELLATTGIKRVHIVRFDARFASLPAERFVEDVLLRGLGTRWLLVGRDFRFGARRAGDFATLEEAAVRHGFPVGSDGPMCCSKASGYRAPRCAARSAWAICAAPSGCWGIHTPSAAGGARCEAGRALGFPTANIVLRRPPPLGGIFAVEV